MVEIDILLIVILAVLCVLASRVGKANELLKELLATFRQKYYPEKRDIGEEPLPPPLTLDEDDKKRAALRR